MGDRTGKAGGSVRDLLREIDRDLAVPAMLGASGARPLAHSVHRAFPLVAAPLPPKDDSPESASGIPTPSPASCLSSCAHSQANRRAILDFARARAHTHTHTHASTGYQPASSGPQDSESLGARQRKESDIDGNSSLQFLWEREQERGRHRNQGLEGEGRAGIARKDLDLQRIHEREKAKALRAQELDQLPSPCRRTEWEGETDSRGRQEESSFLSPFAGRFALCTYACYCIHTAAVSPFNRRSGLHLPGFSLFPVVGCDLAAARLPVCPCCADLTHQRLPRHGQIKHP
jgi:hypothetical protein